MPKHPLCHSQGCVPREDYELCTLQVRSDQVFGPAELWDEDKFDLSDSPHLADMLPDDSQPSSEQADLYKDVQVFGPESLQRGIRAINEEFKENFAEHVQKEPARVAPIALEVDVDVLRGTRRVRSHPRPLVLFP